MKKRCLTRLNYVIVFFCRMHCIQTVLLWNRKSSVVSPRSAFYLSSISIIIRMREQGPRFSSNRNANLKEKKRTQNSSLTWVGWPGWFFWWDNTEEPVRGLKFHREKVSRNLFHGRGVWETCRFRRPWRFHSDGGPCFPSESLKLPCPWDLTAAFLGRRVLFL